MRHSSTRRIMPLRPGFAILLAGLTVAGCASVESVLGPMGNIFSSTPPPPGQQTPGQIYEGSADVPYAAGPTRTSDVDCPQVTVRTGAATWQIPPGTGPTNIRYQASLGQLARECAVLGDTMTVRVGIEGRVLLGPKGGPGAVSIPVRIAVIHEGPQPRTLWTKFYSIPVTMAQGTTQAAFAQVEDDVTFQLPANKGELAAICRLCRLRSAGRHSGAAEAESGAEASQGEAQGQGGASAPGDSTAAAAAIRAAARHLRAAAAASGALAMTKRRPKGRRFRFSLAGFRASRGISRGASSRRGSRR